MATKARTITPKKVKEFPDYLDFEGLRAEGIRHIQNLAGEIWTDHNSHDPGITILELLCYALTDLGYRTNLDIRDLLAEAPADNPTNRPDNNFPTAAHVLTCNPLTILDFRKLLIDTEGVRNAWLKVKNTIFPVTPDSFVDTEVGDAGRLSFAGTTGSPVPINGLYKVLLELDDAFLSQEAAKGIDARGAILENVNKKLQAHRNFCEDYFTIHILRDEKIKLCGEIEISTSAIPDEVVLAILERIQEFLSPTIPFYTIQEIQATGATPDQIFEGRPLSLKKSYGFVDAGKLADAELKTAIHVSDIYRILLATDGVLAVKNLRLVNTTNGTNPEGEEWILPLTPGSFRPVLDAETTLDALTLTKRNVVYSINAERILGIFRKKLANQLKVCKKEKELDLPVELGTYRGRRSKDTDSSLEAGLGDHFSIQNDLPAAYGTSWTSFPGRSSTPDERERQVQALQLKGYLVFFDQLLANYLSQLANVRSLFSTTLDEKTDSVLSVGSLSDVAFLAKLLPISSASGAASTFFSEGETIAKVIDPNTGRRRIFATPSERNTALQQIVRAFDEDTLQLTYITNKETGRVRFQVRSGGGHLVVLQSTKTFADVSEAEAAFGSVRFLATLETSYRPRQQRPGPAHDYTFDWIFRSPADFQQIMRQIVETGPAYFRRKNALFDHLLSRFAEDFTDYTLLMFGLHKSSSQTLIAERMASDKADFIKAYPDISRNRGQGFNQTAPASAYWQGDNVSGIENRLATMLGFKRRKNKQLNFFEIVSDNQNLVVFFDRKGDILLQSPLPGALLTVADFRNNLAKAIQGTGAYARFVDRSDLVFGFKVVKSDDWTVAIHPDTYGSPEARDTMLDYTRLVVRDADRLPVDFVAKDRGFYTVVSKANGTPLFRSATPVSTVDEARQISLLIRRAATVRKQYKTLPKLGKEYRFDLLTADGNKLAEHPEPYLTAQERDDVLADTFYYFSKNPLLISVEQSPNRHHWTIPLPHANQLEGLHFFKTPEQTRSAALRVLDLIREALHLEVEQLGDGSFQVRLLEYRSYPAEQPDEKPRVVRLVLAQTQPVATQRQADQLKNAIRRLASDSPIRYLSRPGQFYAQLKAGDGSIELKDARRFDTADKAEIAFDDVLEAACKGNWDRDDTINNGCAHGFNLFSDAPGHRLATHPTLYDTAEKREKALAKIEELACQHRIRVDLEERQDSWQFELYCPNSEGRLLTMLREPAGPAHITQDEARIFFNKTARATLADLKADSVRKTGRGSKLSFNIVDDSKQVIAEHPDSYSSEDDRAEVIRLLKKYLTLKQPSWLSNQTTENLPEVFSSVGTVEDQCQGFDLLGDGCQCDSKTGNRTDRRRWRVRDEKVHLAHYRQEFTDALQAEKERINLITQHQRHSPKYSDLVLGGGVTPTDGHWVIRDRTDKLWRSPASFALKTEARQAFDEALMPVITASLDLSNYRVEPVTNPKTRKTQFRIELLDNRYRPIAFSDLFDTAILARQDIAKRHEYARLFPFTVTEDGIYFQLYNRQTLQTDWRSSRAYPTWQQALDGFTAFVDMLGFESHYAILVDDECGWQITLIEVMLEGAESFYTKEDEKTPEAKALTFGWDQVETFLDRYQATNTARVVYPYIDYSAANRYRFQLVSDDYVFARHPIAFHTSTERENRRDELFLLWQSASLREPPVSTLLKEIREKFPASVVDLLRRLDNLFVIVERNPPDEKVYLLGVRDETTGYPTVFNHEYATEDALITDVRALYVKLRSEEFAVDRVDGGKGFEIRVANGAEYHQIAGLANAHEFPRYEVLWESVKTYTTKADLEAAHAFCLELLAQKRNYNRYQAPDQSRTLILTNPAEVLATQPRRYDSLSECLQAAERSLEYVDTEGFHIVEHVLLRPRHSVKNGTPGTSWNAQTGNRPVATAMDDEQHEFDTYVVGSDPYSMTATVVLPYWSRRFRSVDFRQFFENTLRRETPVHVLLTIFWITPQQMELFEKQLGCWLNELPRPLGDEFAERTRCLFDLLGQLTNTFPHAVLNDCNGSPVILDETTID